MKNKKDELIFQLKGLNRIALIKLGQGTDQIVLVALCLGYEENLTAISEVEEELTKQDKEVVDLARLIYSIIKEKAE